MRLRADNVALGAAPGAYGGVQEELRHLRAPAFGSPWLRRA